MKRSAQRILSIDPGTTNLGWAWMEDFKVLEAGNDFVWKKRTKSERIRVNLLPALGKWCNLRMDLLEQADVVLIEQQYSRNFGQPFWPMVVMDTIFVVTETLFPGKTHLVHPASVKRRFAITGTYEQRKAQVAHTYRQHLPNNIGKRQHDALDAMLNAWYWLEQQGVTIPGDEHSSSEEERERLRQAFPIKAKRARRAIPPISPISNPQ